jgi:Holliday junction resolvasome RuvABC endonuclease subunit
MRILGFDCATKTGWALVVDGKVAEVGVGNFTKRRGESNGIMFLRFRKWVKELIELTQPDVLCYEVAHHRGGSATEICVGLTTRVMEIATEHELEYVGYRTGEIKKYATGNGGAGKEAMINSAKVLWDNDNITDDEADAILCAMLCWDRIGV